MFKTFNIFTNNKNRPLIRSENFLILVFYALSLILFGLISSSPIEIYNGLIKIILSPDALISDYIAIGGIGATFINSGLLTLIFIFILYKMNMKFSGATVASLFLITGFSFFGKNLLNVWFIIIGVYIFSRIQKDKFSKYIYIAIFGTAMAPILTEIAFNANTNMYKNITLGILISILIGIILPPLASALLRVHHGYNLYNVGFTAGIIGTIFVSILKSFGYVVESRMIWTTGNNLILSLYLLSIFTSMIILGFILNGNSFKNFTNIFKYSGRLISDFIILESFQIVLINMGINGIFATLYVIIIGGDLNGPTIGGIFTIVGFSAFGKHLKNMLPIFIGIFIGSLIKIGSINDPAILLAALFGTSLAPIAGEFGWKYGIVAGFLHSSVVLSVGSLHGGLNLYNNGFSAGLVATFLIPIIEAFRKEEI